MNLLSTLVLLRSLALALSLGCSAPDPGATNVARNGEASQISDFFTAYAKRAIDGIRDSTYGKGSCSHTTQITDPWWKVDLKKNYKIWTVTLTNRMDCCPERLVGAEVRIGNSADNNNPVCGKVTSVSNATISFSCNGMEGRYVIVLILGRAEYLTLCEVEVMGSLAITQTCSPNPGAINLARNGDVSQISDFGLGCAKKAIDGTKNTDFMKGSCSHTTQINGPWWKVDLKQNYKISIVVLTNRLDCCSKRLIGAEVRIGNSPDNNNPVCGKVTSVADATITFCCNGMVGQYVSVVIPGRSEYLTMCEVEIYGAPVRVVTNFKRTYW